MSQSGVAASSGAPNGEAGRRVVAGPSGLIVASDSS